MTADIIKLLKAHYALTAEDITHAQGGAGSDTYFAQCSEGSFVVKFPAVSEMNSLENEPRLCELLLRNGISVCRFLRNINGEYITQSERGIFTVQERIVGREYDWNTAPDWLLTDSARTLGKIHAALKGCEGLPVGIGEDFFRYMTPENALHSYENSLKIAEQKGDTDIAADLRYRIALMGRFPRYEFDLARLTRTPTHGDYFISQLICGEDRINAVIDWTTACVHPAVWELMRSYVYAAPECAEGRIDVDRLAQYFRDYCGYSPLSEYDLKMAMPLFFYQIAVCDYYGQYYGSDAANRELFLRQARLSTRLMRWFEEHADEAIEV